MIEGFVVATYIMLGIVLTVVVVFAGLFAIVTFGDWLRDTAIKYGCWVYWVFWITLIYLGLTLLSAGVITANKNEQMKAEVEECAK